MRVEHIYRDAIAVRLGGRVEIPVGRDSIDVLLTHNSGNDVPISHEVIEVKYAADLRTAMGQVVSYSRRWARANPNDAVTRHIHLITSASPRDAAKESARIREHQDALAEDCSQLTTVRERPDLQPIYVAGGIEFASRKAIERYAKKVKSDFLIAEYLSSAHYAFLLSLGSAWRQIEYGKPATEISASAVDVHGVGMMMSVHGRQVSIGDCIRPLTMLTHYELLSMPVAA